MTSAQTGWPEALVVAVTLLSCAAWLWRTTPRALRMLALMATGTSIAAVMVRRGSVAAEQVERESVDASRPQTQRPGGYVSSDVCRACHPAQYESWHRTYHRTMTQVADVRSVVAPFSGVTLTSRGRTYRLDQRDGGYWVDMVDPRAERELVRRGRPTDDESKLPRRTARVVLTTGSHAMQTYWIDGGEGREVFSLPWMWVFESGRWLPREDVFLRPPDAEPFRQTWNDNCLQCHSTGPQPRLGGKVDTRVGELGIACEACHGPADEHVRRNRSLARRYLGHFDGAIDQAIVDPRDLSAARSSEVCGQCHSKSLINDAKGWYAGEGLTYRPGDELAKTRSPVLPRSAPEHPIVRAALTGQPELHAQFFWPDGIIRVSGREYNGMVESACFRGGQMSCLSCHSMHQGDPNKQLTPGKEGDAACSSCHSEVAAAGEAHTRHRPGTAGSACVDCHMPYTSYGLLRALRSHTIDSPDVRTTIATGRPDACSLCHVDRTLAWAAEELARGWNVTPVEVGGEMARHSAALVWLLGGDAGQRALAAWAFGWAPAQVAAGSGWMAPALARLLDDPYAAVRHVAARSLRSLPGLSDLDYDPVAPSQQRQAVAAEALRIWTSRPPTERAHPRGAEVLVDSTGAVTESELERLQRARDERPIDLRE